MQKGYENRYQVEMISIEDLVPHDHLLRQISEAVDFSKIYEFVEELYCDDNGRPSIDSDMEKYTISNIINNTNLCEFEKIMAELNSAALASETI